MNGRLRGGGGKRARASTPSASSANPFKEDDVDCIKDSDAKLFEQVFIIATDKRAVNVDDMLMSMDINDLREMSTVLAGTSKTQHLLKIKMAVEIMQILKDMITAKNKLLKSIDLTKAKIASAFWDHVCAQSDDNQFDMTILKMNIASVIKSRSSGMTD